MRLFAITTLALCAAACGDDEPSGDGGGAGGDGGTNQVCAQVPDCVDADAWRIELNDNLEAVCLSSGCAALPAQTGEMLVYGRFPVNLDSGRVRAWFLTYFDSRRADGGTLTCAQVLALPGVHLPQRTVHPGEVVNVIRRGAGPASAGQGDTLPARAFEIPSNEGGAPYLVLLQLFNQSLDTTTSFPEAQAVAAGCADGVTVPRGDYVEDEAHQVLLDLQLVN